MDKVFPIEWREEQKVSYYPFGDRSTFLSREGNRFPKKAIIDASIYPIGASPPIYLASVTVLPRRVTITIGDSRSDSLASGFFDPVSPPDMIGLRDSLNRPAGALVVDPIESAVIASMPSGDSLFDRTAAVFVPSVVLALPDYGVRSIVLDDGTRITGEVWMVGGAGVVISEDGGSIRADAVGDPLSKRRRCEAEVVGSFVTPSFLRTINGIGPDDYQDFKLTVGLRDSPDSILRIYPQDGTLKVEVVGQVLSGVV